MTQVYDLAGKRVFVAGHQGMVGSALVRRLEQEGCTVLTATRQELDLTRQLAVDAWMTRHQPDAVIVAAAKVGGIKANDTFPVDFLYDNLMIEANLIRAAFETGVEKLLFLASSCLYPREASQPMNEDALLTGPLEPTNQWYAIAKIAGLKLCQAYRRQHGADFITAIPTNLYGPGDSFDLENGHVPAALMRRFHDAKQAGAAETLVWGSGAPLREFMHVDDMADACVLLMTRYSDEAPVNIGSGDEISIRDFATLVAQAVGYSGTLTFDTSRPDGAPRKLLDCGRFSALGWAPRIPLKEGLAETYAWFLDKHGAPTA